MEICATVVPPLVAELDQATHRFACHLDAATRHRNADVLSRAVVAAGATEGIR
jgi:hypothetical protein